MSKKIALISGTLTIALLASTYIMTKRANDLENCSTTSVAGGAIGGPFELIDENGRTVTDVDVITEPSLIYFGYTFCPDVCPIDVARNAIAVEILEENGVSVTPIFITIDPARDTFGILAQYTDNFHEKMIGLTGSDQQISDVAKTYRTSFQKMDDDPDYYLMQHMRLTYLMMPDVGFVEFFRGADSPEVMAERVACFVESAT